MGEGMGVGGIERGEGQCREKEKLKGAISSIQIMLKG